MKEKAFISFVLQVEALTDECMAFILSLDSYLSSVFENREIILVDNTGAKESYGEIIGLTNRMKSQSSVLRLSRKQSVEIALLAGTAKSIGDYTFQMSLLVNDFPMELIGTMFNKCIAGKDIVSAVPTVQEAYLSRLFYLVFNRVSDLNCELETERIILTSRRALNAVLGKKQRFRYQRALLSQTGFPQETILFEPTFRMASAKRPLLNRLNVALDLFISYSSIGVQISFWLSFFLLLVSFFIVGHAGVAYFFYGQPITGVTGILFLVSFSFSGVFLLLGLMSEYFRHILSEVQGTTLYHIESYHTSTKSRRIEEHKLPKEVWGTERLAA